MKRNVTSLPQSTYQCEVAAFWPAAAVKGAETLYIYMWQGLAMMSMKWVRCSYHNLQHTTSEKLRNSPTTGGQAFIILAAVEGADTHILWV